MLKRYLVHRTKKGMITPRLQGTGLYLLRQGCQPHRQPAGHSLTWPVVPSYGPTGKLQESESRLI